MYVSNLYGQVFVYIYMCLHIGELLLLDKTAPGPALIRSVDPSYRLTLSPTVPVSLTLSPNPNSNIHIGELLLLDKTAPGPGLEFFHDPNMGGASAGMCTYLYIYI
jgi:hypothetical protein